MFSLSFISWVPIYFFYTEFVFVLNRPFSAAFGFWGLIICFSAAFVLSALPAAFVPHYDSRDLTPLKRIPYDVWKSSNCLPVCQMHSTVNTSGVTLCSIKQCYFLFTFSTVNSFKKETMQIVYCQHHITIKFPFIGTWNCSLVNAEFTHKLSLKTSIFVFRTSDEIQTQFCACQKKQN